MQKEKTKIAVFGSASKELDYDEKRKAFLLGETLGKAFKNKVILLTGACIGVPEVVAKEAKKYGTIVRGYSGATSLGEHLENPNYVDPSQLDELILLNKPDRTLNGLTERSLNMVKDAHALVFIGGRIGTMTEFGITYDETEKPIYLLEGAKGFVDRFRKLRIKKERKNVFSGTSPYNLVKRLDQDFNIANFEQDPRFSFVSFEGAGFHGAFRSQYGNFVGKDPAFVLCLYPY